MLELGWEIEIFPGLEYHELNSDEPFHILKDDNDITGLVFMDPIDAKHFYEFLFWHQSSLQLLLLLTHLKPKPKLRMMSDSYVQFFLSSDPF